MMVIKNTQNTNHYLISAGLEITQHQSLSGGFRSAIGSVKIKWIVSWEPLRAAEMDFLDEFTFISDQISLA